jgi:hypothetical protein
MLNLTIKKSYLQPFEVKVDSAVVALLLPVASLQHVQNVQCTPKKGNFGLILCSLKQFFSKNTLALIDFLFLHPRKFYPNDATDCYLGLMNNFNC